MIDEFIDYINQDQEFYDTSIKSGILQYPSYYIGNYLKYLRATEYLKNNKYKKFLLPIKILCMIKLRSYSYKLGFQIGTNCCDRGIKIFHYGFIIINENAKIGKNFSIQPGCVVGRTEHGAPIIGDNVYMAPNSTVMGNVKIGNNVTIAQNSTVTKDIPDNAVVGGVPAKIIKFKR